MLTHAEHTALLREYGQEKTDEAISFLDLYLGARSGKDPYKSHNLALRKWVFDAVEERKAKQRKFTGGGSRLSATQQRVMENDQMAQILLAGDGHAQIGLDAANSHEA